MLAKSETSGTQNFVRDRVAWFCYLMIATYAFFAASLGPLMTFLRSELHLTYAITSYHFSAMAFGVVLSGVAGDRILSLLGRTNTVWLACLGLSTGILILFAAGNPVATMGGVALCGFSGSTMSQTLCAVLAEHFLELRTVAITEANIASSLCCSLSPLVLSFLSRTTLGWRAALIVPVVAYAFYFLAGRNALNSVQFGGGNGGSNAPAAKLPKQYWLCWSLIFFSVASEWSVVLWSSDFFEKVVRLSKADAAACVTSFLAAMVSGRIAGSRLARTVKTRNLLQVASLVALGGFLLFWLNRSPLICVAGLFITGLGISNCYPLTFSLAIASARGLTNLATARMSISTGLATLITPLILGAVAERSGIFTACSLVVFLLSLCCIMLFLPIWSAADASSRVGVQERL